MAGTREQVSAPGRRFTSTGAILLVAVGLLFMSLFSMSSCYSNQLPRFPQPFIDHCYSSIPYLYSDRGFGELVWPYDDNPALRDKIQPGTSWPRFRVGGDATGVMEYPPGIAYWAYGTAWVTHWVAGSPDFTARQSVPTSADYGFRPDLAHEAYLFLLVNGVGLALVALAAVALMKRLTRNSNSIWAFAASPLLFLTAFLNWDLLALLTVVGAVYFWERKRPGWAGVLIGVGAATKLYPLFLLGAVVTLAVRRKEWRPLALSTATAVTAWLAVNAPAYLSGKREWLVFWKFHDGRGIGLGSFWRMTYGAFGWEPSTHLMNAASLGFFLLWCVGVLIVGLKAKREPTFAQLGLLILIGFLLLNKVYSPQYVLWLLPLAVLAMPKLKPQLLWQASELWYFLQLPAYSVPYFFFIQNGEQGYMGHYWFYTSSIAIRLLGECYLAYGVVRHLLTRKEEALEATSEA